MWAASWSSRTTNVPSSNAIAPALELDRARIAANARETFSIDAMVDRYEALLTSVAERAIAA